MKHLKSEKGPGPIVIETPSLDDRLTVLIQSKNLRKSNEYKNIYIQEDMTYGERILNKHLRLKCKSDNEELKNKGLSYHFEVRNNRIVKISNISSKRLI